ncbi:MAG: helix-turn-helix transcriptional regulator [Pseudobdellovibrionaceae bacterium]
MSIRGFTKVPSKEQKYVKSEISRIASSMQARRKEKGLTQEQLAEKLEVSTETIRFIEQSRRIPSLPMLIRIAKTLGVKVWI